MRRSVTAVDLARDAGIDPKAYRASLRAADLLWHRKGDSCNVIEGSDRHDQMLALLKVIIPPDTARAREGEPSLSEVPGKPITRRHQGRAASDEAYVTDLCNCILGEQGWRGHRFDWLVGDGPRPRRLPVDAFYPRHALVIEVHERQHAEAVAHFDKPDRLTVSGVHRGEQRALYDQRRRDTIPAHGLRLIEIRVDELAHDGRLKLLRHRNQDEAVIRNKLKKLIFS